MSSTLASRRTAFAGRRVTQKVALGLMLSAAIPLLVLAYSVLAQSVPHMELDAAGFLPLAALLAFTGLLMAAGGLILWDVARGVSRAAHLLGAPCASPLALADRPDEIGTLVTSVSKMLATIRQQAEEIGQFPARLDQVARQALRDPLTGLPNRALFMDRLAHALARTERRAEPLSVLCLDLDRFRLVNDSLGHAAGDQLLGEVGRRLQDCLRPEDTVARLGADAFGILLEGVQDAAGAARVAERLLQSLQKPFALEGRQVFVTASLGIAVSPSPQTRPEEIIRSADLAMHHAKGKGKAQWALFEGSMQAPARERLDLEIDLRSALARREFTLYYQPVVALDTGRIREVEALIRWEHHGRGLLQPGDFIGLTEESGLIVPIGHWVVAEACRQARAWQAAYPSDPPLAVSVNLSARQVQHAGLVDEVARALRESGLSPASLKLEITENVMMHDVPATLSKLHALRRLGVRLAIDDFGTGYSSLNYLARFPVDTLKIDRSFVKGVGDTAEDAAIVQAVITVAKSLDLSVTAEGIETDTQVDRLLALGCDRGQGYYFARPMPAAHMRSLLAAPRRDTDALHDLPCLRPLGQQVPA